MFAAIPRLGAFATAAGIWLDRHLGNDIGGDLVLLRQAQEPVDRYGVPRCDAGNGLGSRKSYINVR